MTAIKKITLVLNTDDPEQRDLYNFVNFLPNGRKRNSSAFLRTLVDREYQKKKEQYLQEKKTQEASIAKVVQSTKKNIKYLAKDVNQNTNQSSDSSTD